AIQVHTTLLKPSSEILTILLLSVDTYEMHISPILTISDWLVVRYSSAACNLYLTVQPSQNLPKSMERNFMRKKRTITSI
ncbi:hypothetical protein HN011_000779, partial [Eciton burchellii]